jgi:hypothetical protein
VTMESSSTPSSPPAPTRIRRLPTLPTELICSVHSIPSR